MSRAGVTGLLAVLVVIAFALMWVGWTRRRRLHADLPTLPTAPGGAADPLCPESPGTYVGTTTAGDWLDRVVAHGLGTRSRAVLTVSAAGIELRRTGAPDVFVPTAQLRGARLDRALAGKVVEDGGLVVLTWQLGDRVLDTGFRPVRGDDNEVLVSAARSLLGAVA